MPLRKDTLAFRVATSTEAFLHQQYLKWTMRDVEECHQNSAANGFGDIGALSLVDMLGSFVLMSIGSCFAAAAFLIEIIAT